MELIHTTPCYYLHKKGLTFMKILFYGTKSYDKTSFSAEAAAFPNIQIDYTESNLTPLTAALASGYDAVCAFVNADISAMTLDILRGLGVGIVLMRCAGFDAVNVEYAQQIGMKVTRVPAYSPEAIAEHAMGLALAANRRICRGFNRVRDNNFELGGLVGETLHGKTAGIVGTGRIGAALARICHGFGMRVLGSDPYPNQQLLDDRILDAYVELDDIWAQSDLISLHAPLTPQSHHMINKATIAKMKPGVILVNTGRGGLVDTQDLIEGIISNKIGAAGLDVYEEENANVYKDRTADVFGSPTAQLCAFPNVVVTSHQAFFTTEALAQIAQTTLQNAEAYAQGTSFVPRSVVC